MCIDQHTLEVSSGCPLVLSGQANKENSSLLCWPDLFHSWLQWHKYCHFRSHPRVLLFKAKLIKVSILLPKIALPLPERWFHPSQIGCSHQGISCSQASRRVPQYPLPVHHPVRLSFPSVACTACCNFLLADLVHGCLQQLKLHICFWLQCWRVGNEAESGFCGSRGSKMSHSLCCLLWVYGSEATYLISISASLVLHSLLTVSCNSASWCNTLCTSFADIYLFSRRVWSLVATYCFYWSPFLSVPSAWKPQTSQRLSL